MTWHSWWQHGFARLRPVGGDVKAERPDDDEGPVPTGPSVNEKRADRPPKEVKAMVGDFRALAEAQGVASGEGCALALVLAWESAGSLTFAVGEVAAKVAQLEPMWLAVAEILELDPDDGEALEALAQDVLKAGVLLGLLSGTSDEDEGGDSHRSE